MKLFRFNGKLDVTRSQLVGSTFNDVNLSEARFTNINMSNWRLDDVNLQHLEIKNANLSHAAISESCLHDMTINGIPVEELLACYKAHQASSR